MREYDVVVDKVPPRELGGLIARHLRLQGFCVVEPGLPPDMMDKAVEEGVHLEAADCFRGVHPAVADGLLGCEGSSVVAELAPPSSDEEDPAGHPELLALWALERSLTDFGFARLQPHAGHLGFEAVSCGQTLLHKAGTSAFPVPELDDAEAAAWHDTFVRHRLMSIVFLGPQGGCLDLTPHDGDDAETHVIQAVPGMMVLLRPDLLSHAWVADDGSLAMSNFSLGGADNPRQAVGRRASIPAAQGLDRWMMSRLQELKGQECAAMEVGCPPDALFSKIPLSWRKIMNQSFYTGQLTAVGGVACRFPCACDFDVWFRASVCGPDYATEVPHVRWDHSEVYSEDPEAWRQNRSYCKHASFMHGLHEFDFRSFRMPLAEAQAMDPHQRLTLEVGYSAFCYMGLHRQALLNRQCGVYLGCGNNEWMFAQEMGSATQAKAPAGSQSVGAGRFSFVLGLKGPSLTVDTEGSSGLAALHMALESLEQRGRAAPIGHSIAIAVHLCLSPVFWPSHCASGWLSADGRCLTFDSSASGYVRGEGCCAAVVEKLRQAAGDGSNDCENTSLVGCIAGTMMNSNGPGASISAPNGPAEQEVMIEAIRTASMSPGDIDYIESHGSGTFLADAIEAGSYMRVHRGLTEQATSPLQLTALKTCVGHQMECGGLAALMRALYTGQWGLLLPNLHLSRANPHIDAFDQPLLLPSEAQEISEANPFLGTLARGFGGSNVYVLAWGMAREDRVPLLRPVATQHALSFWPGGGGALDREMRPERAYTIIGSWSRWRTPEEMEWEGNGTYGATVMLGENRWEQFQIWLDGDPRRVLHPGRRKAQKHSAVRGPEDGADDSNWLIDGRPGRAREERQQRPAEPELDAEGFADASADGAQEPECVLQEVETLDMGQPGDMYRVHLRIAGRWRTVYWEKAQGTDEEPATLVRPAGATYSVAGSWSEWSLEQMTRDESNPGVLYAKVVLERDGAEFQLVRNEDWNQVLYPDTPSAAGECRVLGPDDEGQGMHWFLDGRVGDVFCIKFQRWQEAGKDVKRLSWKQVGREQLSEGQLTLAGSPRYCIVGSWDSWRAHAMHFTGKHYQFCLELGSTGEESFHLLKDGLRDQAVYPNIRLATPHRFHVLKGPAENTHGLNWLVGRHPSDEGQPRAKYKVKLLLKEDGVTPKKVQWAKLNPNDPAAFEDSASSASSVWCSPDPDDGSFESVSEECSAVTPAED